MRTWIIVSGVGLIVFLVDMVLVLNGAIVPADRRLDLQLHADFGSATDPFFSAVSTFGAGLVWTLLVGLVVVALVFARHLVHALIVMLATGGATLLYSVFKLLVQRPRPQLFHHATHAGGFSFPSGHAADSVALCFAVVFLVAWLTSSRFLVSVLIVLAVGASLLVGLSRVTLGVHYPTDVLGGYAIAVAWCALVYGVFPRWTSRLPTSSPLEP